MSTLNILSPLLACKVSADKSADSLIEIPLYVIHLFSLAVFKILFLCVGADLFGLYLFGDLYASCTWMAILLLDLGVQPFFK